MHAWPHYFTPAEATNFFFFLLTVSKEVSVLEKAFTRSVKINIFRHVPFQSQGTSVPHDLPRIKADEGLRFIFKVLIAKNDLEKRIKQTDFKVLHNMD